MKILVLTSSFRKTGNTYLLTHLLSQQIQQMADRYQIPVDFRTINLSDQNISYCRGCRVCFDKGETACPVWDEIAPIKEALKEADIWIFASPVYVEDVNGVMKVFLERMAHVNHRPEFAGKYAVLMTTSGSGSSGHACMTMSSTLRAWGVKVIAQKDFIAGSLSTEKKLFARFDKSLEKIAQKVINSYRNHEKYEPSFISLLFFAVQQKLWRKSTDCKDHPDYLYWQSNNWLQPGVTFFIPHKGNPLTVMTARMAGSIIALFFEGMSDQL